MKNDDYLTDDDIVATPGTTPFDSPDFIGVVCGAEYSEGVTAEFALAIFIDGGALLFEASAEDLRYLARQIQALVGE